MPNPSAEQQPDRRLEMGGSYGAAQPAPEPPVEDELERAERLVVEAERAGADDLELAIRLGDVVRICFARQAWAASVRPLTRLLAINRAQGEDRAEVATVLSSLATVRYALGQHNEAAQLWEEALRIRERCLVPNHFMVARSAENLADGRAAQGRMDEALALLRRALAIWQQMLPPSDPTVRAIRTKIGDLQLLASQTIPGRASGSGATAPPASAPAPIQLVWFSPDATSAHGAAGSREPGGVHEDAELSAPGLAATPLEAPPSEKPGRSDAERPLLSRSWLRMHRAVAEPAPEPAAEPAPQPAAQVAPQEAPQEAPQVAPPVAPELAASQPAPQRTPQPTAQWAPESVTTPPATRPEAPAAAAQPLRGWAPEPPRRAPAAESPLDSPIPVAKQWVAPLASRSSPRVWRAASLSAAVVALVLFGAYRVTGTGSSAGSETAPVLAGVSGQTSNASKASSASAASTVVRATSAGAVAPASARRSPPSASAVAERNAAAAGVARDAGRVPSPAAGGELSAAPRATTGGKAAVKPNLTSASAQLASAMRAVESTTVVSSDSAVRQMLYGRALGLSTETAHPSTRRGETSPSASRAAAEDPQDMKPAMLAPGGPQPVFPFQLLSENIRGNVVIEVLVDADGRPDTKSARVVQSNHPLFTAAVMRVLPTMRFVPAEAHGQRVAQRLEVPFRFDRTTAGQ